MTKYVILIPSYNDWDCLSLLIPKIDRALEITKEEIKILIVNDGSTEKNSLSFTNLVTLKNVEILNLKKNIKAQTAIATGLSYLKKENFEGGIIVMDADGQDSPEQLIDIISESKKKPEQTITINRTSREDGLMFNLFYKVYLFLTLLFTFKYMKFGVFSYIHSSSLNKILSTYDIQMAYAASLAKHFNNKNVIYAPRKKRILGYSKNNYISLILYALKIISVFKYNVLINSIALICVCFLFVGNKLLFLPLLIFLIFFNLLVFLIPLRINILNEKNILLNIENIKSIK